MLSLKQIKWMENKEWYTVKTDKFGRWVGIPKLTSKAPPEAVESYKAYMAVIKEQEEAEKKGIIIED